MAQSCSSCGTGGKAKADIYVGPLASIVVQIGSKTYNYGPGEYHTEISLPYLNGGTVSASMEMTVDESDPSDPNPHTYASFSCSSCTLKGAIYASSYDPGWLDEVCDLYYDPETDTFYEECVTQTGDETYLGPDVAVTTKFTVDENSPLVEKGNASSPDYLPAAGGGGSSSQYEQMPTVLTQSYGLGTTTVLGMEKALGTLVFEKDLSTATAPSISDIRVVPFITPNDPIEYVPNPSNWNQFAQYRTDSMLVDLSPVAQGFQIRCYDLSVVSATKDPTSNLYTTSGAPFAQHVITQVTSGSETGVQISSTDDGVTTVHSSFATANQDGSGSRTMINGDLKTETLDSRPNGANGERVLSTTLTRLLPGSGSVSISETEEHYTLQSWGEALTSRITDPNGANLETQYFYDANGYMTAETHSDGSWIVYDRGSMGALNATWRPWLDGPASPGAATATNSTRTSYGTYVARDSYGEITSVTDTTTEWVLGTQVSKAVEFESRTTDTLVDGSVFVVEHQRYHGTNTTPSEVSKSVYEQVWDYDLQDFRRGSLLYTVSPAGVVTTYSEDTETVSSYHTGTLASPDGVNGSIQVETVTGDFGVTSQTTKVYSDGSYHTISTRETTYTAPTGYPQTETLDGETVRTVTRPDDTTIIEVDAEGITTTSTLDGSGNVTEVVRNGVTTTYAWSSTQEGLPKQTTTRTAGALVLTSYQVTDLAGRVVESCDENGVVTSYAYSGTTVTESSPGTSTERRDRVTTNYLDGQLKSITGNAVVDEFHTYEVMDGSDPLLTKCILATIYLGDNYSLEAGSLSPRWQETYTDGLGRTVAQKRPGPESTVLETVSYYNSSGQLYKTTQTSMADKLYSYDPDTGEQTMSGYDLNGSGTLELASIEPISQTSRYYEQASGAWWEVQESSQFTGDGSATEKAVTKRRSQLGTGPFPVVETTLPDGTVLTATTVINTATHTRTRTTTSSRSSLSGVQTSINGLLYSSSTVGRIGVTSYDYDDLERQNSLTPPGQTATTTEYVAGTHLPETVSGPAGSFTYTYFSAASPWAGQIQTITDAEGAVTNYTYSARGETAAVWGTASYPLRYEHTDFGELWKMHTFRDDPGEDTPTTAGDVTEWVYDDATGMLTEKRDASHATTSAAVTYAYEFPASGRVVHRTWARGGETVSTYDTAGRLVSVSYSDTATPDVSFTYLRDGAPDTTTDAAGLHTFTYDGPARQETTETISATGLLSGYSVVHQAGHAGMDGYIEARQGTSVLMNSTRTHDADTGLLQSITGPGSSAWGYTYETSGAGISQTAFSMTGGAAHVAVRERDTSGRVKSIRYQWGAATDAWSTHGIIGWSYTYKTNSPQRRATTLPYRPDGGSPLTNSPPGWGYDYHLRGEVAAAVRSDADGDAITGQGWGYAYDAIGNRSVATRDVVGASTGYTPNALNQYASLTNPGSVEISGLTAVGVDRVAVNGQPATGRPAGNGEPDGFSQWLTASNAQQPQWLTVKVEASRPGQPPENEPLQMLRQGRLFIPAAAVSPSYDLDGNLLFDGRWRYTWNGENRLVAVETDAAVGLLPNAPPRTRLEFVYDAQGRRISKVVRRWQKGTEQWLTVAAWKYLHEGWNLVAELDALRGDALERSYIWGTDLSGSMTGAGGVGGLLGVYDARTNRLYSVCTEVNGNVMTLVDGVSGVMAARYDYDAFGNQITAVGSAAAACPFGFSTKFTDEETGLVYYGLRYYSTETGRWLGKDPIEERGGLNLHAMSLNNPINNFDVLGLKVYEFKLPVSFDTGKVSLGLLWLRIKVDGEWKVKIDPDTTEDKCPTKWPKDIHFESDIDTYSYGINAKFGLQGDEFKMIYGVKYGVTIPEGPWYKKVWNTTIDKGLYQDIHVNVQKWSSGITYNGKLYGCACVSYFAKAKVDVEGGIYIGRVGTAIAAYYLWPVLLREIPKLIPPLPVPLPPIRL